MQLAFCAKLKYAFPHRPHYALVDTHGCPQNESDSEVPRGWLHDCGYLPTGEERQAAVTHINTCAVRDHAERRVFGNVGALNNAKEKNPDLIVGVGGCMVQQETVKDKDLKA